MTFFYKNERAQSIFICITSTFIPTKDHMYMYPFQKENVSLVWYYDIRHIFLEHSEKTHFFRKKCAFGCTYFCNKCCFTDMFTKPSYLLEINIGPIWLIVLLKSSLILLIWIWFEWICLYNELMMILRTA